MKTKRVFSVILSAIMLLSVFSVNAVAAETYLDMNFESMDVLTDKFVPGAFYVEDGMLFGYNEARALQTKYVEEADMFLDTEYTWLTYDATITACVQLDELAESERHIDLAYCNDNPYNYGRAESRVYINFAYDIDAGYFRLVEGLEGNAEAKAYLAPVEREIPIDTEEFFTMGISVEKGKMRCFYNGELIFTLDDPDLLIADEITSPFLFWQRGNFIQVSNITVAEQGSIFSASAAGDANGDGKINLSDVSRILQYIAKWDVTLSTDAADVTGDGKVNLSDASRILQYIAKWDVTLK